MAIWPGRRQAIVKRFVFVRDSPSRITIWASCLKLLGQEEDARACYRAALRHQPTLCRSALESGGSVSWSKEIFGGRGGRYQEAMRLQPDYVDALDNYGLLVQSQGRLDEALECFERVVQLNPNSAIGALQSGQCFQVQRTCGARRSPATWRPCDSTQPMRSGLPQSGRRVQRGAAAGPGGRILPKGLALDPNSATAVRQSGVRPAHPGPRRRGIAWYRKSVSLEPTDNVECCSNLLYALNYIPGVDPAALFAEHLAWARRHAEPLTALAPPHANDRTPDRRLRIGYVSAHFCRHAVNYFTEPMLTAHDHGSSRSFATRTCWPPTRSPRRLKAAADQWRDVARNTDEQLAQMVRDDRIDILVDLAGHIGGNRLLVFARKPAPVQVTYIGYQNTTGMSAMDYRLTDERADPPGMTDAFYTEQAGSAAAELFLLPAAGRRAADHSACRPEPPATSRSARSTAFSKIDARR